MSDDKREAVLNNLSKIEDVKPCPFCKFDEPLLHSDHAGEFIVCPNCGAGGPVKRNPYSARNAWNKANRRI